MKLLKKIKKILNIILLTANKNYKEILKQAKILNVKNLIITNKNHLRIKKKKIRKIKIFNNFNHLIIFLKKKLIM